MYPSRNSRITAVNNRAGRVTGLLGQLPGPLPFARISPTPPVALLRVDLAQTSSSHALVSQFVSIQFLILRLHTFACIDLIRACLTLMYNGAATAAAKPNGQRVMLDAPAIEAHLRGLTVASLPGVPTDSLPSLVETHPTTGSYGLRVFGSVEYGPSRPYTWSVNTAIHHGCGPPM